MRAQRRRPPVRIFEQPKPSVETYVPQRRRIRYILNMRLAIISLLVIAVVGGAAYGVQRFQVHRNAEYFLMRARQLEEKKNWQAAVVQLSRYLALQPADSKVIIRMAKTYDKAAIEFTRKQTAIALYSRAIAEDPNNIELRVRQAELLYEIEAYPIVFEKTGAIQSRSPRNKDALRLEALSWLRQRMLGNEISDKAVIEGLESAISANPEDASLPTALAAFYRDRSTTGSDQSRHQDADMVMNQLVTHNPKSSEAYLARYQYRLRYSLGDTDADLDTALQLAPDDPDVLFAAGERSVRRRKFEQAQEYFEHAIEVAPLRREGYFGLGLLFQQQDDATRAVEVLSQARKQLPGDMYIALQLADSLLDEDKPKAAAEVVRQVEAQVAILASRLAPVQRLELEAFVNMVRGQLQMKQKDWNGALGYLLRVTAVQAVGSAASRDIQRHVDVNRLIGQCYVATANWDQAALAFERAAGLRPASIELHLAAGEAWERAGKQDRALKAYGTAVAMPNCPPEAWIGYARTRMATTRFEAPQVRDWQRVANAIDAARERNPESAEVILLQAEYLFEMSDRQTALTLARTIESTTSPALRARLSLLYNRAGDMEAVQRVIGNQTPDLKNLQSVIANIHYRCRLGNYDDAQKLIDSVVPRYRGNELVMLRGLSAQLDIARGDLDAAWQKLVDLAKDEPQAILPLSLKGELALVRKDVKAIDNVVAKLKLQEGPDGCLWRELSGRKLLLQSPVPEDDATVVLQLAEEIKRLRPLWYGGYSLEGMLYVRQQQPRLAIEALETAVKNGDARLSTQFPLIQLLIEQKRVQEAIVYIGHASQHVTFDPDAFQRFVPYLVREGEFEKAVSLAASAMEGENATPEDRLNLAHTLLFARRSKQAEDLFQQVTGEEPERAEGWIGLFNARYQQRNFEGARAALDQLVKVSGITDASVFFAAGQGYEVVRAADEAKHYYREARKLDPENPLYRDSYALFLARSDSAEARSELQALFDRYPNSNAIRRSLASTIAAQGGAANWNLAWKMIAEEQYDATIDDQRLQAILLVRRGTPDDLAEAVRLLREIVKDSDRKPTDRLLLASAFEAMNQSDQALQEMEVAKSESPNDPLIIAGYISALLKRDRHSDASEQLDLLDKVVPFTSDALTLRAQWLAESGRTAEIADLVEQFIQHHTDTEQPENNRLTAILLAAHVYQTYQLNEQAEALFRDAFAKNPSALSALANFLVRNNRTAEAVEMAIQLGRSGDQLLAARTLCTILSRAKVGEDDLEESLRFIRAALEENPGDRALLVSAATAFHMVGRPAEAIELYREVLVSHPNDVAALNNLANLLSEDPNTIDEAMETLAKAVEIAGPSADLMDTKGLILLRKDEVAEAQEVLQMAADSAGAHAMCHFHLAVALHRAGLNQKAQQQFQTAIEKGLATFPLRPDEEEMLRSLHTALDSGRS